MHELRSVLRDRQTRWAEARGCLLSYGLPLLLVGLVAAVFWSRSGLPLSYVPDHARTKSTFLLCQGYAATYQERFPGRFKGHPWTECYDLMEERFGNRFVSHAEAFRKEPADMLGHLAWNASLMPSGVQLALFNGVAGTSNPDFVPVPHNRPSALVLSIVLAVVLLVGGTVLYRDRHYWWAAWLRERAWGWLLLLAMVGMAVVVIPIVKPRPELLYGLWLLLMAVSGLCAAAIARRLGGLGRVDALAPALVIAALLLVPGHDADPASPRAQPLRQEYERLAPFWEEVGQPGTVLLHNHPYVVRLYLLAHDRSGRSEWGSRDVDSAELRRKPRGVPAHVFLQDRGVTLAYLDKDLLAKLRNDPDARALLRSPESVGWDVIGDGGANWRLLRKTA